MDAFISQYLVAFSLVAAEGGVRSGQETTRAVRLEVSKEKLVLLSRCYLFVE